LHLMPLHGAAPHRGLLPLHVSEETPHRNSLANQRQNSAFYHHATDMSIPEHGPAPVVIHTDAGEYIGEFNQTLIYANGTEAREVRCERGKIDFTKGTWNW